jgi:hypothetical protein
MHHHNQHAQAFPIKTVTGIKKNLLYKFDFISRQIFVELEKKLNGSR